MIVMKFGGTSVEDAPSIERVAGIVRDRLELKPIVVVSAMAKTTRRLLEAAGCSASGDSRSTLGIIADLKTRHVTEARRLIDKASASEAIHLVDRYFDELKKLLEGLAILGEVPPRGLDKILAYGELLSSAIVASAFRERGVPAALLDSRQFIKTDDKYGSASPIFEATTKLTCEQILPVVEGGQIPVVQGFIGSAAPNGATTTLGFEGSDYTAALVGAALDAADIQIWKDVSGLMTADPTVCNEARTVKRCTFAEAADLTYLGAKVLHPKAIFPAAEKNIPVHIYNSKDPRKPGTEITSKIARCLNPIKSITYKKPVTLINLAATGLTAPGSASDDFLASGLGRLVERLRRRQISPLVTAISGSNARLVVSSRNLDKANQEYFLDQMSRLGTASMSHGRAILSLVGEELKTDRSVAGIALRALDAIGPEMLLHGASPMAVSIVIDERDFQDAMDRLHGAFFSTLDPAAFE